MTRRGRVLVGITIVGMALPVWAAATVSASGAVTPRCFGQEATIVGTPAKETLRGTAAADVIVGGGSNGFQTGDSIYGLGGDDRICAEVDRTFSAVRGGRGDDRVRASGVMWGGPGSDELTEPDRVISQGSILIGGPGDDVMVSRATDINWFVPGPGDDSVSAFYLHTNPAVFFLHASRGVLVNLAQGTARGQGHDTLKRINGVVGSDHADVVFGSDRRDDMEGLGGQDVLVGRGGGDTLDGNNGGDVLVGRGGGDALQGGKGDDRANGGPGGDFLSGDRGRDMLLGRGGNDELVEKRRPEANLLLAGPGRDRCYGGYRVPPNIERGCEAHKPPRHPPGPRTDDVSPNRFTMYHRLIQDRRPALNRYGHAAN